MNGCAHDMNFVQRTLYVHNLRHSLGRLFYLMLLSMPLSAPSFRIEVNISTGPGTSTEFVLDGALKDMPCSSSTQPVRAGRRPLPWLPF